MTQQYADRVHLGAELLDRWHPGWHRAIERARLRMETCNLDVLGLLYGDFRSGFRALIANEDSRRLFSAAEHGFTLHDLEQDSPDVLERFRSLGDAWRAEIAARLEREAVVL